MRVPRLMAGEFLLNEPWIDAFSFLNDSYLIV